MVLLQEYYLGYDALLLKSANLERVVFHEVAWPGVDQATDIVKGGKAQMTRASINVVADAVGSEFEVGSLENIVWQLSREDLAIPLGVLLRSLHEMGEATDRILNEGELLLVVRIRRLDAQKIAPHSNAQIVDRRAYFYLLASRCRDLLD